MNRIKKKDLLARIENLEEAVSILMMDRFININGLEIEVEKKPKKKATKKKEEKPTPKRRGRKPKKEVK